MEMEEEEEEKDGCFPRTGRTAEPGQREELDFMATAF